MVSCSATTSYRRQGGREPCFSWVLCLHHHTHMCLSACTSPKSSFDPAGLLLGSGKAHNEEYWRQVESLLLNEGMLEYKATTVYRPTGGGFQKRSVSKMSITSAGEWDHRKLACQADPRRCTPTRAQQRSGVNTNIAAAGSVSRRPLLGGFVSHATVCWMQGPFCYETPCSAELSVCAEKCIFPSVSPKHAFNSGTCTPVHVL